MSSSKSKIGVIGLAVMGKNLAKNFASRNILTSVFNRSPQKTRDLLEEKNPDLIGFENLEDFVQSLEKPRKIILMVKSGSPVDSFIEKLYPLLDQEDIIIDAGNSNWKETNQRIEALSQGKIYSLQEAIKGKLEEKKVIHFIGCGVSGGEEGALKGPSIMPGGDAKSVQNLLPLLEKVAAADFSTGKCVKNIGLGASGHFVKMVHNGIEYAIMQIIAEVYDIFRLYSFSNQEIQKHFQKINQGNLEGFLMEITTDIFGAKDLKDSSSFLVDKIMDVAKAKGTGAWTVEAAMEFGVAAPSIASSVFARTLSARNQSYNINQKSLNHINKFCKSDFEKHFDIHQLKLILEEVILSCYLQGLDIINQANQEKDWQINIQEVARIWQGGCIIRCRLLEDLPKYFEKNGDKLELNFASKIADSEYQKAWQNLIALKFFVPTPVLDSTFNYLLGLANKKLPTNLIQAQRDFFGAHTYKRVDQEGVFSGGWNA